MWSLGGLITGVVAAIISAPTAAIVFGGVTGAGTDLIVAALRTSGQASCRPLSAKASFQTRWTSSRAS
jgi:energy-coupling factor transport system substrate-specific component